MKFVVHGTKQLTRDNNQNKKTVDDCENKFSEH